MILKNWKTGEMIPDPYPKCRLTVKVKKISYNLEKMKNDPALGPGTHQI